MPGNIAAASPVGIFPQMTYTSFVETRSTPLLSVTYHDPTIERSLLSDGVNPVVSLRTWKLSAKFPLVFDIPSGLWLATQLIALRTFFEAHQGIPFTWYNPMEPAPGDAIGSNYDPTGDAIEGRYIVIFRMPQWTETVGMMRTAVAFDLAEVA